MQNLLESRELIRLLRKGAPIEVEGETVRLPRFSEIKETFSAEFGVDGNMEVIVAKSRTVTWCLWPLDRKTKFEMKDGERFVKIVDAVKEANPQKPVKGWVLTTAPFTEEIRTYFKDAGHQIHRIVVG